MTEPGPLYLSSREIPGGVLTYVVHDGVVISSTFRGEQDALGRSGLDEAMTRGIERAGPVDAVGVALDRYCAGDVDALEAIEVRQPGGEFQQRAWAAMRTIRAGSIDTYAGLARRAGNPRAYRAAGTACSSNLVAPFVPCHRVVAAHGPGGYGYGLDVKFALLAHEGVEI